uniref:TLC domain-containing protein n=1 Tax=Tetraselmis chuii TaxID=63592 RepID=A0A7S1X8H7_9CHLO
MFIIRAAIALYCMLLQVEANFSVGIRINRFYTSWNWCILCLYFIVAARESWKLMRANGGAAAESLVSRNGQLAVVLFHICTTMAMYIDTITWVALVPMLTTQNKDAEAAARFAGIFYSFRSYNQHGVNLLFMLLDYSLNRIPYFPHMLGYIQLLSCAFGVWANIFYLIFDVWLYPFLDTSKPWAWEAYTALFVSHWLFFLLFHVLMKVKQYLEKGALVKKAA